VEYRVLTVNREFGSGGGRIAETIAKWLGWKLLDRDIIDAIAYAAHVDSKVVRHYDEHVDSWLRRINQQAMRSAALAAGLELGEASVFDADEMVKISQKIIEKAYADGNCVIVGRGSQCSTSRTYITSLFTHRIRNAFCACAAGWRRTSTLSSASAPWMKSGPNTCSSISASAGTILISTT
jgi:hypothetical protein